MKKALIAQASMEEEDSDEQLTQSGAAIISSNDDLLIEICLRLPVTSILRLKSVCKHWRWLLSHPSFTQRYDNPSKSPGLFARDTYIPFDPQNPSTSTPPFPGLHSYFDRPGVRIVQSCNGLLLCCSHHSPRGCTAAPKYYVFNPTTKQLATVPPLPGGYNVNMSICFMGLAFHPTDCVHFKLVCMRGLKVREELYQVQLYSSVSRKWKTSVQSFYVSSPGHWSLEFRQGVYWNGAVHWGPHHGYHLYFRLDVEQLQTLPLPAGLVPSEIVATYFGESRGHLHLIFSKSFLERSFHVNVYEMLTDHSGWFVKYQLQLHHLPAAFPDAVLENGSCAIDVIDVVRGEEEENTFVVLRTPEKLITYNVYDKSFKKILGFTRFSYGCNTDFSRYIETVSSF